MQSRRPPGSNFGLPITLPVRQSFENKNQSVGNEFIARRDSGQNWTGAIHTKLQQITFSKLARSPDSKINVRSSLQKKKKSEEKPKLKVSEQYFLNNY
jgi:hypothetical protein